MNKQIYKLNKFKMKEEPHRMTSLLELMGRSGIGVTCDYRVLNTECWVTSIPYNNMNKKEMGNPAIFCIWSFHQNAQGTGRQDLGDGREVTPIYTFLNRWRKQERTKFYIQGDANKI
jgi:hypothetical protein